MKCRDSSLGTHPPTLPHTTHTHTHTHTHREPTCLREAQLGQAHGPGISIHSIMSLSAFAPQETESTGNHIARWSQEHRPSLCTD